MTAIGVLGTGSSLPAQVVGNDEVGPPAGVGDEWIVRKTGIHSRRWAKPGEATSDFAVEAGRAALERAGLRAADLSMIVVATSTPDSPQPPTACAVAEALGAGPATAAFDLNAVCPGFVFALSLVHRALVSSGGCALVIGADVYSRILNRADRRTAVLFGDGAGAVVLGAVEPDRGVLATRLMTFGEERDLIRVPAGGSRLPASPRTLAEGLHYFTMEGRAVSEFVSTRIPEETRSFLGEARTPAPEIAHLIPHQGNGVMLRQLETRLGLPRARMHTTVRDYGNTGAASIAITLDHAVRSGAIRPGEHVLLVAFGGGFAFGFALLRW